MEEKTCSLCGAKTVEYRHIFNESIAYGLKRLYEYGKPCNIKVLNLNRNQWDNFQKLRYWGLVRKHYDKNGKRVGGYWEITEDGKAFILGNLFIQDHVVTYRGERVKYEGESVNSSMFFPTYYKKRVEYADDAIPHPKKSVEVMFPKIKRVIDKNLLASFRGVSCCVVRNEHYSVYPTHVGDVIAHHLKSKGSGGDDVESNLIPLCAFHHTKIHEYGEKKFLEIYEICDTEKWKMENYLNMRK